MVLYLISTQPCYSPILASCFNQGYSLNDELSILSGEDRIRTCNGIVASLVWIPGMRSKIPLLYSSYTTNSVYQFRHLSLIKNLAYAKATPGAR